MAISLSGLDLSSIDWSWEPPKRAKKRLPNKRSKIACPYLMGDIQSFVSPIDGTEITSRSALRAHEIKHNVRQAGDFKPGELIERENKRVAHSRKLAEDVKTEWIDP